MATLLGFIPVFYGGLVLHRKHNLRSSQLCHNLGLSHLICNSLKKHGSYIYQSGQKMLHYSNKQPPTLSGLKQQSFAFCLCCIFISSWQEHLLIVSHLDTQANGQSPSQKLLVKVPEGKVSCEGSCIGYEIYPDLVHIVSVPNLLARTSFMSTSYQGCRKCNPACSGRD